MHHLTAFPDGGYSHLIIALLLLSPASGVKAEEGAPANSPVHDIARAVDQLENAIQGKDHRPLEEFVAENATFQGMRPLRKMLKDAKPVKFDPDSRRFWLPLSKVEPKSKLSPYLPQGVDAENTVLVFRDTDAREDRRFRVFYWLSNTDGKWMVVYNADGWDSLEPLASAAQSFPNENEKQDTETGP